MNTKAIISMLAALAFSGAAVAETEGFKISGDIATSLFSESGKGGNDRFPLMGHIAAPSTANPSPSNHNDFTLDMAEINLEKGMGNTNFVLGIGYGGIFDQTNNIFDINTSAPKSTLNLTNAYINHKFGDSGVSVKLGKFESFMGYETNNYMDNLNYTRSYAFTGLMPFYHTGVGVNYGHEMFDVGVYMVNSHKNTDMDDNGNKSFGVSASLKMIENLMLKVNYLTGKEGQNFTNLIDTSTLNVNVGYMMGNIDLAVAYASRKTEAAITGGPADADASSIAAYAGYKMDNWGAGLRYEMLTDDDGMLTVADNSINAITASGWYDIDTNARVKLEIASHSSDKPIFTDDKGVADDAAMSYGLGVMYRF